MKEGHGQERCVQGELKERDHLKDLGLDGRIILKWMCRKLDRGGGMVRIGLAQDRDRCPALVNAVMNLRVPSKAGISCHTGYLLTS